MDIAYYIFYLFALFLSVIVTARHIIVYRKIKSQEVKVLRNLMLKQTIGLFCFIVSNLVFAILAVYETSFDWLIFPLASLGLVYYSYQTDKLIEFYKPD